MRKLIILVTLILLFVGCQQKQTTKIEIVGYGEDAFWQVTLLPLTNYKDDIITVHVYPKSKNVSRDNLEFSYSINKQSQVNKADKVSIDLHGNNVIFNKNIILPNNISDSELTINIKSPNSSHTIPLSIYTRSME